MTRGVERLAVDRGGGNIGNYTTLGGRVSYVHYEKMMAKIFGVRNRRWEGGGDSILLHLSIGTRLRWRRTWQSTWDSGCHVIGTADGITVDNNQGVIGLKPVREWWRGQEVDCWLICSHQPLTFAIYDIKCGMRRTGPWQWSAWTKTHFVVSI